VCVFFSSFIQPMSHQFFVISFRFCFERGYLLSSSASGDYGRTMQIYMQSRHNSSAILLLNASMLQLRKQGMRMENEGLLSCFFLFSICVLLMYVVVVFFQLLYGL